MKRDIIAIFLLLNMFIGVGMNANSSVLVTNQSYSSSVFALHVELANDGLPCSSSRISPAGWSWKIYWTLHPTELYPSISGYADVWLENTGDTDLHVYRIWFQWEWQTDVAYYRDVDVYLSPGEKKYLGSVAFSIPTDMEPDYYGYRLGVSQEHKEWYGWADDGVVWMAGWKEVRIYSAPEIEIIFCDFETSTIYVGNEVTLIVKVKNLGEATAEDVYVRVSEPDGLSLAGSSSSRYVGSISGESIYELTFTYKGAKAGTYTITVDATSENAGTDSVSVTITVQSKGELSFGGEGPFSLGIILLSIVMVTAIAAGFIIFKKRSLLNQKYPVSCSILSLFLRTI